MAIAWPVQFTTAHREMDVGAPYCSSLTFSIQSTTLPFKDRCLIRIRRCRPEHGKRHDRRGEQLHVRPFDSEANNSFARVTADMAFGQPA